MTGSTRLFLIGFALCGAFPLAACSRMSDGTVVMKKPPPVSTLVPDWMRVKPRHAEPVSQAQIAFPPPPEPQVRPRKHSRRSPIQIKADANLACFDRGQTGKRVRVVCK